MVRRRRRGLAIVETPRGILVVSGRSKVFYLPSGGAEKWESREKAALRELYEETGLKAKSSEFLFSYVGRVWCDHRGRETQNHTKVFKVEVEGTPRAGSEISHIDYWNPDSNISNFS
jgi:8-oxo-dGTP diphosphatase